MFTDPKELGERFYDEVVNQQKYELIDDLVDEHFVEHEEFPGISQDRAGIRQFFELFRGAFPDMHCTVERMIAEGDLVAIHSTTRGTHEGELMGVPATGNKVEFSTIDIVRVANDKAVEHWGVTDGMAMMEQIGAFSAEGAASA